MRSVMRSRKGFTLIELVIVLVLIGILAAVAIPKFQNMKDNAEAASIRGTLGNVRSAITIYRANKLAEGEDADVAWPADAATVQTDVIENAIPANPWAPNGVKTNNTVTANTTDHAYAGGDAAWLYNPTSGLFWANTQTDKSNSSTGNVNTW